LSGTIKGASSASAGTRKKILVFDVKMCTSKIIFVPLALNDEAKELQLIHEHSDSINQLKTNAMYHYKINLMKKE
jgi:hypothetical protein